MDALKVVHNSVKVFGFRVQFSLLWFMTIMGTILSFKSIIPIQDHNCLFTLKMVSWDCCFNFSNSWDYLDSGFWILWGLLPHSQSCNVLISLHGNHVQPCFFLWPPQCNRHNWLLRSMACSTCPVSKGCHEQSHCKWSLCEQSHEHQFPSSLSTDISKGYCEWVS